MNESIFKDIITAEPGPLLGQKYLISVNKTLQNSGGSRDNVEVL